MAALVNEQAASLQRTAFSNVVREAGDLSAGIFYRQGRMLAQAVTGTPGHINTMASAVVDMLVDFPPETLADGDVLLTNEPCAVAADIPHKAASFRHIHFTAPEGCLLNAQPPQPVAARHIIGHFAIPAVMGALGQAVPLLAEGATGLWGVNIQGTERPWAQTFFLSGGMGAGPEWDGLDATAFPSGVQAVPVEVIEVTTPVRILEKSLIAGSGGAGTHTGGRGQRVRLTVDEVAHVSVMAERTRQGALGETAENPGTWVAGAGRRTA